MPRELAEVGEVAFRAGYNRHVASHVSDRLDVEGLGSLQSLRAFLRSFLLGKDEAALGGLVKDMVDQKWGLWVGPTPLLATEALLYVFIKKLMKHVVVLAKIPKKFRYKNPEIKGRRYRGSPPSPAPVPPPFGLQFFR